MAVSKNNFAKALTELKKAEDEKHKKRNFDQTVDLIINLRNFDVRKTPINSIISLPHKVKDKKILVSCRTSTGFCRNSG